MLLTYSKLIAEAQIDGRSKGTSRSTRQWLDAIDNISHCRCRVIGIGVTLAGSANVTN